jgi:hypothetical protein
LTVRTEVVDRILIFGELHARRVRCCVCDHDNTTGCIER